ncbi:uncharacterized protein N7515_002950 [Penicillium bovifimosum]|uniref:Uncharacterized protein n=1 Tax=Penicillium bovifimosum TaxID=126998 RepID=A0A9W9HCH8_9EURO|nr:uncharacterized protein N7515_002950 [Penicillium bovifimosum]KAJ5144163.1 hypothetical protein N7515_002950 [Penicillium bovifimosum]
MSTQSPHPPTPKGSRTNRRPQKKNMTPQAPKSQPLSTPPSSPPQTMTPGVLPTGALNNFNSSKKAPRSGKKQRDPKGSATPQHGYHSNGYSGQRQTPNHPAVTSPLPKSTTPAYAGPTFHASPAPSALPIPSFFSKSAPDSKLAPPIETDSDDAEPGPDATPSKPRNKTPILADEQKPSPLDFLFQAAVQARDAKSTGSHEVDRLRSPQTEPRAARTNPDGMFAFEIGNSDHPRKAVNSGIGPSFAPSYQDRMNALRPPSASQSPAAAEEQHRRRTEELKQLLLNPPAQKPPSLVQSSSDYAGTFGPRPSNVPPYATPVRTSSGPPLTLSNGSFSPHSHPQQPHAYPHYSQHAPLPARHYVPPPSMPQYHGRASNGHPSGGYSSGPSPAPSGNPYLPGYESQWSGHGSPHQSYAAPSSQMPVNSPLPSQAADTRQIENDIRRVLKLDTSGGAPIMYA